MKNCLLLFIGILSAGFSLFGQSDAEGIISTDQLFENFENYVVIDVSRTKQFDEQAISGAINIWRPQITRDDLAYGGLMGSQEKTENLLSDFGISTEDHIVVYDHKGGSDAARMWWLLKYYGHSAVEILDGGLKAWGKRNQQLDTLHYRNDSTDYQFSGKNESRIRRVELAEMKAALDDTSIIIIDTRNKEEYEGAIQKDGAFRKGRIPGSIHIDWACNVNYKGDQLLREQSELLDLYESHGVTKDKKIIVYCHSGVRSTHTAFVLTQVLGYPDVGNYDGSWIEWSYHEDLPIDTGAVEKGEAEYIASYSDIFFGGFKNYANYTWSEITCAVSPWYVNYFWLLVVLSLVVWGLEIVFPWRKNQPIIRKDFWIDTFFMFFNFYIFNLIIFISFSGIIAKLFHDLIGGDATSFALFDMSGYALWIQLLIFFVATDFISWFTHVLLHRFNFLWRFHKVHHSIEQMGFAGHLRYHWMENVVYTPMKYIAVMLIGGFTPDMAYIVYYATIAIGHFNHANIGWDYGPLKYILNNPKMHIWHHAKKLPYERRYGANFGISLSIWDYIFGKSYIPSDGRDIELGFDGIERYPRGFFGLILSGFKRTPDEEG